MKKTDLDLLVGMVKRDLKARGFSTVINPGLENGELLKMQRSWPDSAIETVSMIQPNQSKYAFFFRIRRELGAVYEVYELYAGGWWYGVDLFKPTPLMFGKIDSHNSRKYITDRISEGMNMLASFFRSGDDGLRSYERKRIKIVGGSQDAMEGAEES